MDTHVDRERGRLNAIQHMMLQWSQTHPYNACHLYKLAGRADAERLQVAVQDAFAFNRLGAVELAEDGRHYTIATGSAPDIEAPEGTGDSDDDVRRHVARALNRPFPRPRCHPLRFALIPYDANSHWLAATYDHWTADSVASRLVLRHVLGRYLGLEIPASSQPLTSYTGTYRDAFKGELGWNRVIPSVLNTVRRSVFQSPTAHPACFSMSDMTVDYRLCSTAPGTVARLRKYARSLDATVHDVMLAALARALARHLPRRLWRGRPRDVALGTIVNTRPDASADVNEMLGAFLAYHVVRSSPDTAGSFEDAVRQIHALTAATKAKRGHLNSLVSMKLSAAIWPYLKEAARPHFLRRVLPLTAGISNVVLRDGWLGAPTTDRILGYARAASTGPMVPLVLSPTTVGNEMNLGLSFRVTAFSSAKIDAIQSMLLEQLDGVGRPSVGVWPTDRIPTLRPALCKDRLTAA